MRAPGTSSPPESCKTLSLWQGKAMRAVPAKGQETRGGPGVVPPAPPPAPPLPQPLRPAGFPHAPGRPGPSLQPGVAAVCVPGALEPLVAWPHAVHSRPRSSPPLPSPGGQAPPALHPWPQPPRAGPQHTCTCTHMHACACTHTCGLELRVGDERAGRACRRGTRLPAQVDDRDLHSASWSHVRVARLAPAQTCRCIGLAWGLPVCWEAVTCPEASQT